jgi:hypothetical protein
MTFEEAKKAAYGNPSQYMEFKVGDIVFDFVTGKEFHITRINYGWHNLPVSFYIDYYGDINSSLFPGNYRTINEIVLVTHVTQEVQNDISRSESGSDIEPDAANQHNQE